MMQTADRRIRKHILVVDDDPVARCSLRMLLNLDRHLVTEAADGEEALALFLPSKFDLIITDYLMPRMRGDQLAEEIWKIAPTQPILIVTAYFEKLLCDGQPAEYMLSKPWTIEDLRQAVAEMG